MSNNNINNLNVLTFIKDIYQSLKHIDKCFNDFNTDINSRITKIEDNQQIILDKLNNVEILLSKQGEINNFNQSLDKNLENSLLEKITKMNNMNTMNNEYKIDLKPDELTFANILENNYSFLDINSSLSENDLSKDLTTEFSSSSGSSYYKNNNTNNTNTNSNNSNNTNNSNVSEKIENLNNLLF